MTSPTTIRDCAADFLWRNGRLLERQVFAHLFLGGPRQPALAALLAYQHAHGGFGHALEPDKRCPDAQPIDQEIALRVLDDIGFDAAVAGRICDFLTTITTAEGGVPFVLPSARAYPAAPWWQSAPDAPPASVNPTASIAGLLHKHGVRHPWLERATAYCWAALEERLALEVHEALAVVLFLEHVPDRARAARAFAPLAERLRDGDLVALDPDAAGYVKKPLEWAPTPTSLCRPLFDDAVITAHLDRLQAEQAADGGWPITWPPLSPAVECEYRGWVTVQALKTLRAYGRER
ncbi:MAG: hypothetical protein IT340_01295 [Chloroflexi bacterium]|nr:hypothetical protein [Chloroflexota bacterium]